MATQVIPERRFEVWVFQEGKHTDENAEKVIVNCTLPALPLTVESWQSVIDGCCWEAYSGSELVAYRNCKK